MKKNNLQLIIYICNHGFAYEAMKVARKVGARGGTILNGRSSISTEKAKFFGITLHPEKDVLFIVEKEENSQKIMNTIMEEFGVTSKARGLAFTLPIDHGLGFSFNDATESLPNIDKNDNK